MSSSRAMFSTRSRIPYRFGLGWCCSHTTSSSSPSLNRSAPSIMNVRHMATRTSASVRSSTMPLLGDRSPVVGYPLSSPKKIPSHIVKPPYAESGVAPMPSDHIFLHTEEVTGRMRQAARLARRTLDLACSLAEPGVTTDEIDTAVHNAILAAGAYPSPLNYDGFPKSLCSSINEVICHGIPDTRPLQLGDVVSFDVSCFLDGVHGDNCATVIVGDCQEQDEIGVDWRGVPYRTHFDQEDMEGRFVEARRLVQATRESVYAAIDMCKPGGCLTEIGAAIHQVADSYGYSSVEKYRGHGICHEFHCPPFVKHFRNNDRFALVPGMIFTIEPMLTQGSSQCFEWDDNWTVSTIDGGLSAQFEHTVLITDAGVEILTVPGDE